MQQQQKTWLKLAQESDFAHPSNFLNSSFTDTHFKCQHFIILQHMYKAPVQDIKQMYNYPVPSFLFLTLCLIMCRA